MFFGTPYCIMFLNKFYDNTDYFCCELWDAGEQVQFEHVEDIDKAKVNEKIVTDTDINEVIGKQSEVKSKFETQLEDLKCLTS